MNDTPAARAQALPHRAPRADGRPPWQAITHWARLRGECPAFLVLDEEAPRVLNWSQVATTTEQAAAGLIRGGLRVDQVVLSLLPADHPHPALDLAIRAVGAVLVHVGPHATASAIARDLQGTEVRLVVVNDAQDLRQLRGLNLQDAEVFVLEDGDTWGRLLKMGTDRLKMDPAVVTRASRVVEARSAVPRLLRGEVAIGRAPHGAIREGVLHENSVALSVGDASDPLVAVVAELHLTTGFALCRVTADKGATAVSMMTSHLLRPSVITASELTPALLTELLPPRTTGEPERVATLTPLRRQAGTRRPRTAGDATVVVSTGASHELRAMARSLKAVLEPVVSIELEEAELPRPHQVVAGDVSSLPRRTRGSRHGDFDLRVHRLAQADGTSPSGGLPSIPLISGESFLDQLLLTRTPQARE